SFCVFAGFTIEIPPLSGATRLIVAAADLIPVRPGSANVRALFCTAANLRWFLSVYATSTYVTPPWVEVSAAATPELPRAPMPVGQLTATPLPGPLFHVGLTRDR